MKRAPWILALALMASVLTMASAPASAATANGTIVLEGLTLADTQFGTPSGQPTTVPTDPLAIPVTRGDRFLYSTITCASPFPPWNSFGLHFTPDYPGITDPASVRHEFEGTVTYASANRGTVQGTITSYLCEDGVRTDQIVVSYQAAFSPTSARSVPLLGGGPVPTTGGLASVAALRSSGAPVGSPTSKVAARSSVSSPAWRAPCSGTAPRAAPNWAPSPRSPSSCAGGSSTRPPNPPAG